MATAGQGDRERIEELQEIAEDRPERLAGHRDEIVESLFSADPHIRQLAAQILVPATAMHPFEYRRYTSEILSRLDDTAPSVRINTALAVGNLAQWYPHRFGPGTDILVHSLQTDDPYEQLASAKALVEIGRQRPDLVTPRSAALEQLEAIQQGSLRANSPADAPTIRPEPLEDAIMALRGGDLASRPLEDDLAPVGRCHQLSKPARVGLMSLLWVPLAVFGLILISISLTRFFLRDERKQQQSGATGFTLMGYVTNKPRAILSLRRAVPTPGSLLPWLPGESVVTADPTREAPSKPDNWQTICQAVYDRDGGICRNCEVDTSATATRSAYVDFQVPQGQGGDCHPSNLRILCGDCLQVREGR